MSAVPKLPPELQPKPPSSAATSLDRRIRMLRTAMGPLIAAALEDPDVVEIMLNPDGSLWIDRLSSGRSPTGVKLSEADGERIIRLVAAHVGTEVHRGQPLLTAELPETGERFEGILPPAAPGPAFALRKRAVSIIGLERYVADCILTEEQAEFLRRAVREQLNILIAGGTSTGKTTLANALLAEIAATGDRLLVLEDTVELQCAARDHVSLRTRSGVVSMAELVRATMRLRPDRVIVGEVRGGEALDLIKVWGTGHPGGIATIHASSAHGALLRMEQLILEVALTPPRALIAEAVNVVVFIAGRGRARHVQTIARVVGFDGHGYQLDDALAPPLPTISIPSSTTPGEHAMMNLAEYRKRPALLADWLPWAGLVASGVVLNKDGSFQRTARFRGPDLDSATQGELIATSARLNNALRRLGSGWALFVEAERRAAADYPHSDFPEPLSWLVDEERRASFEEDHSHFESSYHLTLAYLPAEESRARAAKLLYENTPQGGVDWRERLESFVSETDRFFDLLDGVMPEIDWLDDSQTLTYLHATVSTRRYRVAVPEHPFYLDALLADSALLGGLAPMLGDQHLRVASVRGFPTSTWPGLLDDLNRLGFAYRWSTRFLCMDKSEAEKELTRLRRQWFAKRKNVVALLRETIFQQESPLVDTDASNKANDADAALQELGSDQVAFGYVTATVTVLDADASAADEKLRRIERVIQGRGFVTIPETLNAVEAWLSSIPGNAYANVRQPIISTLNLAHLMPVSAVWAGPERNDHLDGPPLIVTRTDGATPFRLVTHIGDVGHTLVVGPTGMGKSVLLAALAMQFRRYPGSRIFAFDMGRSMRATILGLGGEHYDLGTDGEIAFQPLARIDQEGYRTWAAEWLEGRLLHEGAAIGPEEKAMIWSALGSLAGAPVEQRTLTGLSVLLQSNALRQALQPYVLGGAHGKLLDADSDRLGSGSVQCFEMEELMHSKAAVLAVLGYLFARFDERFDGAPTLLILDEAWLFLDDPVFAARIRQWLKTLRKKNVSVIFATQSLADIQNSSIAPAIVESCASRIFLPNPQATEPQIRTIYEGFGLNRRQIDIVAEAVPKRDYYYQSRLGNRLFDLDLGSVTLAFAGASTPQDQRDIDAISHSVSPHDFAAAWLRHRGLDWAADLVPSFPHFSSAQQENAP